jgi:hypothetical protein
LWWVEDVEAISEGWNRNRTEAAIESADHV